MTYRCCAPDCPGYDVPASQVSHLGCGLASPLEILLSIVREALHGGDA